MEINQLGLAGAAGGVKGPYFRKGGWIIEEPYAVPSGDVGGLFDMFKPPGTITGVVRNRNLDGQRGEHRAGVINTVSDESLRTWEVTFSFYADDITRGCINRGLLALPCIVVEQAVHYDSLTVYNVLLSTYCDILDILVKQRQQFIVPIPTIYWQEISVLRKKRQISQSVYSHAAQGNIEVYLNG